jgi:hypothetical protein
MTALVGQSAKPPPWLAASTRYLAPNEAAASTHAVTLSAVGSKSLIGGSAESSQ